MYEFYSQKKILSWIKIYTGSTVQCFLFNINKRALYFFKDLLQKPFFPKSNFGFEKKVFYLHTPIPPSPFHPVISTLHLVYWLPSLEKNFVWSVFLAPKTKKKIVSAFKPSLEKRIILPSIGEIFRSKQNEFLYNFWNIQNAERDLQHSYEQWQARFEYVMVDSASQQTKTESSSCEKKNEEDPSAQC